MSIGKGVELQRKTASIIILFLLVVNALAVAHNVQPVRASATIYIRADGSIDPSTAPIFTADNITYTLADNINDSLIVVQRSNIAIDGNGCVAQGFRLTNISNVTIRNTIIVGGGVYINSASYVVLSGNIITRGGVVLELSSNNTITENIIMLDTNCNVYLTESSGNTISQNYIGGIEGVGISQYGIEIYRSSNNMVIQNKVTQCVRAIRMEGVRPQDELQSDASNNTIIENNIEHYEWGISLNHSTNNTVVGNNITCLSDTMLLGESSGISLDQSYFNSIAQNIIESNRDGLTLGDSHFNNISQNNIRYNINGILLGSSTLNLLSQNNITRNNYGILIVYSYEGYSNTLRYNNMTGNRYNFGVERSYCYVQDVDETNTVDGKPVYYWVNRHDSQIPLDAGYVAIVNSTNIRVEGLDLRNNYQGILIAYSNNTIIRQNNVTNNQYGMQFDSSYNNNISGNNITNNDAGIDLSSSSNNSVSGNSITANNGPGIDIESCSNNSVIGNNITDNGDGIYLLYSSSNNSVGGNNITANGGDGIWLYSSSNNSVSGNSFVNDGLEVRSSYGNVVTGNLVNGKPLVYLEDVSDYAVGDAGQVVLVNCNNVTVENLNLSNTTIGVELWETNNTTISGNNITANNWDGIWLESSSNNSLTGNNIANNGGGIVLEFSSNNNSVGGNNITANGGDGIWLYSSSNNSVSGNSITANNGPGISIQSCSNNSVIGNNITNNGYGGIYLDQSSDNRFYHNTFNAAQVDSYGLANVWDDGYPSGGNYWSDYVGIDVKSGSSQDLPGSDGIGDTPYIIDANNRDRYPLMNPWTPALPEFAGTVHIRANGSIDPPDAPLSTVDNVTYTLTGNITSDGDGMVVERDDIVVDGRGYTLLGSGRGNGATLADRSNVTVRNMTIRNFDYGIELDSSSNSTLSGNNVAANNWIGIMLYYSSDGNVLSGNNVANNWDGIELDYSSNNVLSGNNVTANNADGIDVYSSDNNVLSGNNVANNYAGIVLGSSSGNTLSGNVMRGNRYNFGVGGDVLSDYLHSVDTSNLVDGKPVYYFVNQSHIVVNADAYPEIGYLGFVNCANVTVQGLNLTNNGQGLLVEFTNDSKITGNNFANNEFGIWFDSSSNSTLSGNNVTANTGDGIWLDNSSNNVLSGNNVTANNADGIRLYYSSNNSVFHNSFVNDTNQVYTESSNNTWDDAYPSGGNYWSNYTGVDMKSGFYQNETGSDGIGDMPHIIDASNRDNYPLMKPWTLLPVITATLDVEPHTLNLGSKSELITAYLELPEGYNVSDVDVSTIRLNETIPPELEFRVIGNYDNDAIPDLMVRFNRTAVAELILSEGLMTGNVTLTVTGNLADGNSFQGSDVIIVRMPGDVNVDGKVDGRDIVHAALAFGSCPRDPRWNCVVDENEDNKIDGRDIVLIALNFGKAYP